MEQWKSIVGFNGVYEASNMGRIRNVKTGKVLNPFKDKGGYLEVDLWSNGEKTRFKVHRIIAELFLPNNDNKPCVNHLNLLRDDNRVENIEWCTYSENNKYAYVSGNKKSPFKKGKQNKTRIKKVAQFTRDSCFIQYFDSVKNASIATGVNKSSISLCANNKIKKAGGFLWKYID